MSSGHGWAVTHRNSDAVITYVCPAQAQDNPSPSMERGAGHEVPLLAEEQLAMVSCWELSFNIVAHGELTMF